MLACIKLLIAEKMRTFLRLIDLNFGQRTFCVVYRFVFSKGFYRFRLLLPDNKMPSDVLIKAIQRK